MEFCKIFDQMSYYSNQCYCNIIFKISKTKLKALRLSAADYGFQDSVGQKFLNANQDD